MTTEPVATLLPAATTVAAWPLVPTRSFDEPLTWELPDELAARVQVGSAIEVPVGGARRVAVVASIGEPAPDGVRLRPATRVLPVAPVPTELVELAGWIADQYGCARTRALSLVVSPRLAAHAHAAEVPTRVRVQAVRATGVLLQTDMPGVTARLAGIAAQVPATWTPVSRLLDELGTTRPTLRKLVDHGAAEIAERHVDELEAEAAAAAASADGASGVAADDAEMPQHPRVAAGVELTQEQIAAVEACGVADASLLMGITGSGKTEVYLELIQQQIDAGRSAIVLVPEIALTPQTSARFLRRFPGQVEVLHSQLTRAQRADAWQRISAGERRVIVGPRSAVFAPVSDLGIIVIDEEHDSSYKQDNEPRYDARRVAWRRAQLSGARIVFGSATPRPESWHGVATHVRLHQRASGAELAPVELVDLRLHGDGFPITDHLSVALDGCLRRGRKAIVLHNRRGWANALHCTSCGTGVRCTLCDVAMVVHGRDGSRQHLDCHHCGTRTPVPTRCASCGATDIARLGAGTEKLEQDLADRFGVRVVRLDADAARTGGGVAKILDDFAAPGPAILVGTQMVAKGHDFPDVELAAVVDADTALAIPDFRAQERAFSLVAQLAGRAGRQPDTAEHARVVVQSWDVEQPWLMQAQAHDVEAFLADELVRRERHGYPPYSRIVRVLVSAPRERDAHNWATAAAEGMRHMEAGPVLGPAHLMRIGGRERMQVFTKTHHAVAVAAALRTFVGKTQAERQRSDVRLLLDVDPQSLV